MSAHSSGPWMAHGPSKPTPDAPEGGDWCIQDGGTNIIAETFYRVSEGAGGTRPAEANARLIAAAPDLLAALRDLDECYCDVRENMPRAARAHHRKVLLAARTAIANATGSPQ